MEDERKELLEQASKNLEGEALTEEETDINKVYGKNFVLKICKKYIFLSSLIIDCSWGMVV